MFALVGLKIRLAAACIQRLGEAPCLLILGIPPACVLDPVLLFHLADGGQDVKFTPAQRKRGQVETQGRTFW